MRGTWAEASHRRCQEPTEDDRNQNRRGLAYKREGDYCPFDGPLNFPWFRMIEAGVVVLKSPSLPRIQRQSFPDIG